MKKLTKYIDWSFCLVMAVTMHLVFSLGRWFDETPLPAVIFIAFYYLSYLLNRKVGVPLAFKGGNRWIGSIILLLCMVWAMMLLTHYRPGWPFYALASFYNDQSKVDMSQQRAWIFFLMVQAFSIAVGVLNEYWQLRSREQELEQQRDKAELALFRAQLSPHILYNTLNSVYGLIVTKSDNAEQAFTQAIELSRYMSSMTHRDHVPVDEEAEYIRNYIDLQRLRLNEHTHITFTYNNRRTNAQVAPMLLITFVGNALKYGSSQSRASDINISLTVDDEGLRLLVSNPIHAGSVRQSSGTGIQNCRNRLELIYPHRYVLDIVEQNEHFTVNLFIKI
ncbi:MAG: histidine kinase [Muribaculaceae bacterium]|nr:histidine kinase [Muribaculaceae bacterium]